MSDISIDGMALAPGVAETIVSIAASNVEGVACVGSSSATTLFSRLVKKPATSGIEVELDENDGLVVMVRIEVYYGYVLPDVAASVRESIANAVESQIGLQISSIDIYIDGIQFVK